MTGAITCLLYGISIFLKRCSETNLDIYKLRCLLLVQVPKVWERVKAASRKSLIVVLPGISKGWRKKIFFSGNEKTKNLSSRKIWRFWSGSCSKNLQSEIGWFRRWGRMHFPWPASALPAVPPKARSSWAQTEEEAQLISKPFYKRFPVAADLRLL